MIDLYLRIAYDEMNYIKDELNKKLSYNIENFESYIKSIEMIIHSKPHIAIHFFYNNINISSSSFIDDCIINIKFGTIAILLGKDNYLYNTENFIIINFHNMNNRK